MNDFERVYQIDPFREENLSIEKNLTIELSDREHLERLYPQVTKKMAEAGFIYRPHASEDSNMTECLKKKFEKAKQITKDTKTINLRKEDAPSKSKSIKKKSTKIDS